MINYFLGFDLTKMPFSSIQVDLNGQNKFQVGLALTALGNLGTADMCRDLAIEVDKHLKVSGAKEGMLRRSNSLF